ncbi:TonB family protein [Spirosoma sp. HMF3257]|uniref:TonB C-terminal domain-containing protein n=1 Tax=Spirosoma telluris TaxID=2183553 RepID=A0A327NNV6_9BACT|nr:TonB family protein [Spirosoma telluris]RAI77071.1 hypothetical protein HMF3257_27995 [Spirosoma telluris]
MNALDYLLKANLYGLLFASCYWLLLRRHTFFTLNRAYLLASVILSLILPLVILPTQTVETLPVPIGVITLPMSTITVDTGETGPDWEQLGIWGYGLVSLVLLIRLAIRVGRLAWLIRRSPRQQHEGYMLVQPNDPAIPTFSFFQYVILNPADTQNELIFQHELVHVRQCHSADVLGMGVLQALFWACPTLWLMDRLLRQVHEFLADQPASQPIEYARFLVAYSFGTQPGLSGPDALTNSFFNPSLLKQRIVMLHQKATTRWALGKYILVLPLVFGLLAMTTAREEIASVMSQATDETITVSGQVTSAVDRKPLPGVNVILKNTSQGTSTDSEGKYQLANVPKSGSLVFSFVGFTSQEVKVNGHNTINASLSLQSSKLNEVVVVAYEPTQEPLPAAQSTITKPDSQTSQNGEIFTVVEQVPEFPGGMQALGQYLTRNLRYPAEAQQNKVQGRVFVQFIVSQTGEIQSLRILKGIGSGCDEEAVRVVSQMPRWNPGKQNGRVVSVQYNLPIQFSLEKREDKRSGQVESTTQPESIQKKGVILDNSKNGRYALYDDLTNGSKERYSMRLPDSLQESRALITIRSQALNGGEPLYILDGIEVPTIFNLKPENIENITVLKDAAARFRYGAKGLNGVILITTKKK